MVSNAHRPFRVPHAVLLCGLLIVFISLAGVQPFLAVSCPSGQGILVVEAWIPKSSLEDAVRVFRSGHYHYFVLVGGPMTQSISTHFASYADSAEGELRQNRIAPSNTIKLAARPASNRTFATAVALQRWLRTVQPTTKYVDVFTTGVHARKSWVLFRYALGDTYHVGVIAGPEHSYDPRFWLASPRGVWIVSRNVCGYAYSKVGIFLDAHGWRVLAGSLPQD